MRQHLFGVLSSGPRNARRLSVPLKPLVDHSLAIRPAFPSFPQKMERSPDRVYPYDWTAIKRHYNMEILTIVLQLLSLDQ